MKGLKLYLAGCGLLLLAYLVAQYYKPKPTDWTPSYLKEDKIPYGLYILHQRANDIFPNTSIQVSRQPVYNTLKGRNDTNVSYLIVGGALKLNQTDYHQLLSFVKKGNHVFIASFNFGKVLSKALQLETGISFRTAIQEQTAINFVNPRLKSVRPYTFGRGLGEQHFSKLDTTRATVLGKNQNDQVNFVEYRFGKGAIYLLPNPQLLTNYALINRRGAEYAAKALSYLPQGDLLIWDEYNSRGNAGDTSIFRVLFKHDQLRWAYYLTIAGFLLFVLFGIKRRQRIIPLITPLRNSSVDFVKVVGRVYYQRRDNDDIAQKKAGYFLEFIRTAYRLKTNVLDNEFCNELIRRSGASTETVTELINYIRQINHPHGVTDTQLINLNTIIEKFYKQVQ